TSMAAPVVAGAAALLLQANPRLTPNMIKMILMYTAQQVPNFNLLEQGAGELNIDGAVRLAKAIRPDLASSMAVGSPLLTRAVPTPSSKITYDDELAIADTKGNVIERNTGSGTCTFQWSQGIIVDHTY